MYIYDIYVHTNHMSAEFFDVVLLVVFVVFSHWANPNVFHGKSAMADDSDVLPSGLVNPVFSQNQEDL